MNKKQSKTAKRSYKKPRVERIKIDNQISMVMMSQLEPIGDPETTYFL